MQSTVQTVSNIYNFMDYREFLKDRYRQLKGVDPMFSFRHFSKSAGFGSPNYLKLVMDGKRNLSFEAISKFAKGLRLDSHESEFFRYMVEYNQCEAGSRKDVFEAKLLYLRELFKVKSVIPELYDYYHEWYHSAIREWIKKGPIKNNPVDIAAGMVPAITKEQAAESVELLLKLKFIGKTMDGHLITNESTTIDAESDSLAQKIHHEQMAELAAQSIYTQGPETQDFESLTLSLPASKVNELRDQIQALVASCAASVSSDPADAVYQFNIQFFAVTRPRPTKDGETTTWAGR